jgi:phosphohistidine phosphatase
MMLSLLRHGIAVQGGSPEEGNDSERPLTAKGERRVQQIAEGMSELGLEYDLILSSPYRRAQQTAERVAEILGTPSSVQLSDLLTPAASARQLITMLRNKHRDLQHILLVGHEPCLSRLISTLLTGGPDLTVDMKKGGLCTLDLEALRYGRCASLVSLLTPRQLRRLA